MSAKCLYTKHFNNKYFKTIFIALFLIEILSFLGWLVSDFNTAVFIIISISTLILTLKKLEYGLYILLAELFVGSQGYLFSLEIGSTAISIRMALFIIIMTVWVYQTLFCHSDRSGGISVPWQVQGIPRLLTTLKAARDDIKKCFVLLGLVILWAFVWGLIRGNNFGNVFLDFNNWLYFLLILPVWQIFKSADKEKLKENILAVLSAAVLVLSLKSLLLLYFFSHEFSWALDQVYRWVRDTRVGEITLVAGSYYRVFIQSQIFALLLFFVLLSQNTRIPVSPFAKLSASQGGQEYKNKKASITYYLLFITSLATIILSFSRSFWFGLVTGLFLYYFILVFLKNNLLQIIRQFAKIITITATSILLIFITINLPPVSKFQDFGFVFQKRATQGEAASSSRLNQLAPLAKAIISHPVIGSGFGTSVTYITDDPRIVTETAGGSGEFTTYTFEWGYLDMILKFGLFGLAIYLILIYNILKRNFKFQLGFFLALIVLITVHVFSPYLNHPLGIGFIILTTIFSE